MMICCWGCRRWTTPWPLFTGTRLGVIVLVMGMRPGATLGMGMRLGDTLGMGMRLGVVTVGEGSEDWCCVPAIPIRLVPVLPTVVLDLSSRCALVMVGSSRGGEMELGDVKTPLSPVLL